MGIFGFYGPWLSARMRQAFVTPQYGQVTSLSLDFNALIHKAVDEIYSSPLVDDELAQVRQQLEKIILELVEEFDRTGSLLTLAIAVDGVAPASKLYQQRQRRFRPKTTPFNKDVITPGTDFMIEIDTFLHQFIDRHRMKLPQQVIYSSHLEAGEGEHKILEWYRTGLIPEEGSHVIYGRDSDLVMLCLNSINNIYVVRDDTPSWLDVEALKEELFRAMGTDTATQDFVLLGYLVGNDFLPHAPSLADVAKALDSLLEIYSRLSLQLTDKSEGRVVPTIKWENFGEYLRLLATKEPTWLAHSPSINYTYPAKQILQAFDGKKFLPDVFRSRWYYNALTPQNTNATLGRRGINLAALLEQLAPTSNLLDLPTNGVEDMCAAYLTTLAWTFQYYLGGLTTVNNDWSYNYRHAPLFEDLADLTTNITPASLSVIYKAAERIPYSPLHQLVSVLPLASIEVLPIELRPLFRPSSSIYDILPNTFIYELNGVDRDYKGVALVPFIPRQRVYDAVAQIQFTLKRSRLWVPHTTMNNVLTEHDERERQRNKRKRTHTHSRTRTPTQIRTPDQKYTPARRPGVGSRDSGRRPPFTDEPRAVQTSKRAAPRVSRASIRPQQQTTVPVAVPLVNTLNNISGTTIEKLPGTVNRSSTSNRTARKREPRGPRAELSKHETPYSTQAPLM
jgi:hypothetical protein